MPPFNIFFFNIKEDENILGNLSLWITKHVGLLNYLDIKSGNLTSKHFNNIINETHHKKTLVQWMNKWDEISFAFLLLNNRIYNYVNMGMLYGL